MQLLDAAAHLFNERGFHATSMRDIAKEVGMLSGSIYYHFQSKEEMLLAVYEQGMHRIAEEVDRAVDAADEPWQRLEAACTGHLRGLLAYHDYGVVMIRTLPSEAGSLGPRIRELRRAFEARFRALIDDLALPDHIDRRYVLLMLFGALNWSHVWYHPGGDPPATVARRFLEALKYQLELRPQDSLRTFATS
ncbi:MAG TPA: TetR/AcrR family transcriptional regulator [Candidatus Binataceae bacterium]|nr:TetR/AcrR family transcriptional regulator [Candidatus Binataceae bacterium]